VPEPAQVLQALPHAALVVEHHLAGWPEPRQLIADRDGRDLPGD
jgi:hypothetical protein